MNKRQAAVLITFIVPEPTVLVNNLKLKPFRCNIRSTHVVNIFERQRPCRVTRVRRQRFDKFQMDGIPLGNLRTQFTNRSQTSFLPSLSQCIGNCQNLILDRSCQTDKPQIFRHYIVLISYQTLEEAPLCLTSVRRILLLPCAVR